jgi:DNA-binding transcriptional MerR regulator
MLLKNKLMPQRKRTIEEIKKRDFLKMSELAELNNVRYSTIKFYAELGLLPYEQQGKRLAKYYPAKEASQRLKEILKLRDKGQSVGEVISHLVKQK